MHPDASKSVAIPNPNAGTLATTAESGTNLAIKIATIRSGSTGKPRVYSAGTDSGHLESWASYPITKNTNLARPPVVGSNAIWKTIIARSSDEQLQKNLEHKLASVIIETLDMSVERLMEVEKLGSVTSSRQDLQAAAARLMRDHLIRILDDHLASIETATTSERHSSPTVPAESSSDLCGLVMAAPVEGLEAECTTLTECTTLIEPSMLIDRLKDFDLTVREHELPAWRAWLASMKIGPAVLDAIAHRAANLDSVWTAITANPMEKIRPALKAICWAGVLADLDIPAGTKPKFSLMDEAQLKRLANAGRMAEQDLASAVARMHDICSAFIDDYGYVKIVTIHRELTGKYGMASTYAERVGTAYAYAWVRRQQPGSPDLQRSFAAQLKQDICSGDFADMLAGIAEESGDRATCAMLLRRQHAMLLQYCESVLGRSMSTRESPH